MTSRPTTASPIEQHRARSRREPASGRWRAAAMRTTTAVSMTRSTTTVPRVVVRDTPSRSPRYAHAPARPGAPAGRCWPGIRSAGSRASAGSRSSRMGATRRCQRTARRLMSTHENTTMSANHPGAAAPRTEPSCATSTPRSAMASATTEIVMPIAARSRVPTDRFTIACLSGPTRDLFPAPRGRGPGRASNLARGRRRGFSDGGP